MRKVCATIVLFTLCGCGGPPSGHETLAELRKATSSDGGRREIECTIRGDVNACKWTIAFYTADYAASSADCRRGQQPGQRPLDYWIRCQVAAKYAKGRNMPAGTEQWPREPERLLEFSRAACLAGSHGRDCGTSFELLVDGDELPQDFAAADALMEQLCASRSSACNERQKGIIAERRAESPAARDARIAEARADRQRRGERAAQANAETIERVRARDQRQNAETVTMLGEAVQGAVQSTAQTAENLREAHELAVSVQQSRNHKASGGPAPAPAARPRASTPSSGGATARNDTPARSDDPRRAADEQRRADEDKRKRDQAAIAACTKGDMAFNRFGIIASNLWGDVRYVEATPGGAAWTARKREIAQCSGSTCVRSWHQYVAQSKELASWASERATTCPGLTDACGAPAPLQSNAVDVDCTGYETNKLCVDALEGLMKDADELERFNTCAIQFVDWYRAHPGDPTAEFSAGRSYTPPARGR